MKKQKKTHKKLTLEKIKIVSLSPKILLNIKGGDGPGKTTLGDKTDATCGSGVEQCATVTCNNTYAC